MSDRPQHPSTLEFAALERERDEARAERDELQVLFDAQHRAEMRGIAAWRAENPEERDLSMPSTERFTVWLLNERERLRVALLHYASEQSWGSGVGHYPVQCVYGASNEQRKDGFDAARAALAGPRRRADG